MYFISAKGVRTIFLNVTLFGLQYGVIFISGLPARSGNRIEQSIIHDIHCDSVTFGGYGELVNTYIFNNGWDCGNGNPPIPGYIAILTVDLFILLSSYYIYIHICMHTYIHTYIHAYTLDICIHTCVLFVA